MFLKYRCVRHTQSVGSTISRELRNTKKELQVNVKKLAATVTMTGAVSVAALGLGLGVGTAQADGNGHGGCWPWPCDAFQGPPGHNPFGPPGQVKKDPFLGPFLNPVYGVPPGHWDDRGIWIR